MTLDILTDTARRTVTWVAAALMAFLIASVTPAVALAIDTAPHVQSGADTDVCAMCHRTHSATGDATWETTQAVPTRHSALLTGEPGAQDTLLCYSCHGVDALGSGTDIQSSFEASSAHSLAPTSSAFGPQMKSCSTCHDSHGTARTTSGTPYPRLLRAVTTTGGVVYGGDALCSTCHGVRAASRYPGLSVWKKTAHARIAAPTSGSGVVCSACHDPHGSSVAPSLASRLTSPSAPTTFVVSANDRTFCLACHTSARGTWRGVYAGSSHASSTATASVTAEYATPGQSRRVGECVNCHAPMGRDDGTGSPVAALLDAQGRVLCDRCHRMGGAASTDFASLAFAPTTPGAEIVGVFPAAVADYGRTTVWSRESSSAGAPASPLERSPFASLGDLAVGDFDGDGAREAVISDASNGRAALIEADPLSRVKTRLLAFPAPSAPAVYVSAGDVFPDASGLPELVCVSAAGDVDVLRLSGGALVRVASAAVTGVLKGVACGDIVGGDAADIAIVTTSGLFVLTENGASLDSAGPFVTGGSPVSVAIGDLWAPSGTNEIAVANSGAAGTLAIMQADGSILDQGAGLGGVRAATAVLVGDVLPGVIGTETVLAYRDPAGSDGVRVVEQVAGGGIGAASDVALGAGVTPTGLSFGDADNDGTRDLAVALAGRFTRDALAVAPATRILTPNGAGDALTGAFTLAVGGVEAAGGAASVAIADLGAVPPSRHPVSVVAGAHVSTEAIPATRHVECADCHNVHEASGAASDTAALPGQLVGAWGVQVDNVDASTVDLLGPGRVSAEYEVCLKCHGGTSAPRQVASEFNTRTASFHPVEGPSTPSNATGTTMQGVSAGDTIECDSCHGSASVAGPKGPHRSTASPLLQRRMAGADASDPGLLCLKCHLASIYVDGSGDGVGGNRSGFFYTAPPSGPNALHAYHTGTMGLRCDACHVSHGGNDKHLLRDDTLAWSVQGTGGRCTTACHTQPATPYVYDR